MVVARKSLIKSKQSELEVQTRRAPVPPTGQSPLLDDYELFKSRIKIDRDSLDIATEEQAAIFLDVCDRHVNVISLRDAARDAVSRTDASIARDARIVADKEGRKLTENMINDIVMLHAEHIRIKNDYDQLKKAADMWGILRDAFEQRMRMLRELVNLYSLGYYSTGSGIGPKNSVRDALASRAREGMDQARKERK